MIFLFALQRSSAILVGRTFDNHPKILHRRASGSVKRLFIPQFPRADLRGPAFLLKWASIMSAKFSGQEDGKLPVPVLAEGIHGTRSRAAWSGVQSPCRLGRLLEVLDDTFTTHLLRYFCSYISSLHRGEMAAVLRMTTCQVTALCRLRCC